MHIGQTGIIPFTFFGGANKVVGSTALRVDGLVKYASDFSVWKHGRKYDNLIFQKVYWKEMMETFTGPKILDLCDPDWVGLGSNLVEVGELVDGLTCSSPQLADFVKRAFPKKLVEYIPDRFDFKTFPRARTKHLKKAKNVVWFGFIHNAHETLQPLAMGLLRNSLKLTIIADKPYDKLDDISMLNPDFILYDSGTVHSELKKADIVLNPRSSKALFKYKSNNKSVISWRLGLPVASSPADLERLMSPEERNRDVEVHRGLVETEYDIARSAEQYRKMFQDIQSSHNR